MSHTFDGRLIVVVILAWLASGVAAAIILNKSFSRLKARGLQTPSGFVWVMYAVFMTMGPLALCPAALGLMARRATPEEENAETDEMLERIRGFTAGHGINKGE